MDSKSKPNLTTDTDLYYNLLADKNKLKLNIENNNKPVSLSISEDHDEEDNVGIMEEIDFNSSESSIDIKENKSIHLDINNKSIDSNNNQYNFDNIPKISIQTPSAIPIQTPIQIPEVMEENKKEDKKEDKFGIDPGRFNLNPDDIPFEQLDKKTQKFKRMEKFAQLVNIKNSGINLTKDYTLDSNYDEMCFEVKFWTDIQTKNDAVNLGKNLMVNGITLMEFMNERYDPFGFKLKGWSDHIKVGIDGYDEVVAELYEKYKGSGRKMEPEIKLMIMLITSAGSFHASKVLTESIPGMDDVLKNNPEYLQKVTDSINKGISGSKQGTTINDQEQKLYQQMQKQQQMEQQQQREQQQQQQQQQQTFSEMRNQQEQMQRQQQMMQQQMQQMHQTPSDTVSMSQPDNKLDTMSILEKVRAQNSRKKTQETKNNLQNIREEKYSTDSDKSSSSKKSSSSRVSVTKTLDNSEIDSASIVGSDGQKKPKRRTKKQIMSIST